MAERVTQREWDAARQVKKAEALKTVAKNAKDAQKAKDKALAKGTSLGNEDFLKRAKALEDKINGKGEEPESEVETEENPEGPETPTK